jgi:hypothetical protein
MKIYPCKKEITISNNINKIKKETGIDKINKLIILLLLEIKNNLNKNTYIVSNKI